MNVQAEVEWYRYRALHRKSLAGSGSEPEAVHRVHRRLDQALGGGGLDDPDTDHPALLIHVRVQDDRPFTRLRLRARRVLGNDTFDHPGRRVERIEDLWTLIPASLGAARESLCSFPALGAGRSLC